MINAPTTLYHLRIRDVPLGSSLKQRPLAPPPSPGASASFRIIFWHHGPHEHINLTYVM